MRAASILRGALLLLVLCSALAQRNGSGGDGSENEGDQYMMVDDILSGNEYYAALEVSRDATQKDVKKAFRTLSLKLHPDKRPVETEDEAASSDARYELVVRARHVLADPHLRRMYDDMLDNGIPFLERYYNRYAYRYGAPRTSPLTVLLVVLGFLTVGQYFYLRSRFFKAVELAQNTERYKVAARKQEEDQLEIAIHGINPPRIDDLLPSRIFLAPFSICMWVVSMYQVRGLSQQELLRQRALESGMSEEEWEERLAKWEAKRKKILSGTKYKKYMRMRKKMAQ